MTRFLTWQKAWSLLGKREKRNAWIVLTIIVVAALASAIMVGSVMPFLMVLAEPERIKGVPLLAWFYEKGQFEESQNFLFWLGMASLIVILSANLIQILRAWVVTRFATMRSHSLSHRLLSKYLRQPYDYFLNKHSGEMSTHVLAETAQVVSHFFAPAADVIASSITIVAIIALLVWVNPMVAIVSIISIGAIYGGTYASTRRAISRLGGCEQVKIQNLQRRPVRHKRHKDNTYSQNDRSRRCPAARRGLG